MAAAAIFSSPRRRRSPSLDVFLAPVELSDLALIVTLSSVSEELVPRYSSKSMFFQRKNCRSLIRRIEVFAVLLEYLRETESRSTPLPAAALLCFKELYLLLYKSKILLDYCSHSGKLWLLLQNRSISGHFHDLNQEIYTLLDVFPINEVDLNEDIREQMELLQRQSRKDRLYIDKHDEALRVQLFGFLDQFEKGNAPSLIELEMFFIGKLGIRDARSCKAEIEFLEEKFVHHQGDVEPSVSMLNGFIALTRYCRFLLYDGSAEEEDELVKKPPRKRKNLVSCEIAETFLSIPKDFCCPISLDLMRDPVITSTGQTYDRCSISRWVEEGHVTCPKTGQLLSHMCMVSNRALRNLIMLWCAAHGIPYEQPVETSSLDSPSSSMELLTSGSPTKAAMEANKATAALLVCQLRSRSQFAKAVAAREIRFLAKTGKENRAFIAEAGAIPYLKELLGSENGVAQENSVTAMLNLSIYEKNKCRIMEEKGCLESIVDVLRRGHTTEARENAAATLFSLSAVHDYKKRIADEVGAIEALAGLLREGTSRGKKDAVTALFNISTHFENCLRMIEAGAVQALVGALGHEDVSEEAAGALALIVRQPFGAEAVGKEESAVAGLMGMMRGGSPRGKENAVSTLLELCRRGGSSATEQVVNAPALAGLLQTILFTGTKRARRKAASLARVFQRSENAGSMHFGGLGVGYAFAAGSGTNRSTGLAGDVSMSMSISVPVL